MMAFLPNSEIKRRQWEDQILGPEYEERFVKQASYDLRLGDEVYIVGHRAPDKLTSSKPYVLLAPGQFAILTSHEAIKMPENLIAFIAIRTQFKMQGLVNISGFHVDPSFRGKLLFAVQNVGPADIRLRFGDPTFSIFFSTLAEGDIGGDRDKEEVHFTQNLRGIRLQDVQLLGGNSITLSKIQKDVDRLRTLVFIYGPFAVAGFLAMLAVMAKLIKP
jgi:dCTP deaminase